MNLSERRTHKGWSQEDLALHSGLSVRTIQRVEAGNPASLETLKCLAAVFETSITELVEDQTMTTPSQTTTPAYETDKLTSEEEQAVAWVQNLKAFHLHWISFIPVMALLYWLNQTLSPEFQWVRLVGGIWLGALVLHAFVLFGMFQFLGPRWEQKHFQKRMNRMNHSQH